MPTCVDDLALFQLFDPFTIEWFYPFYAAIYNDPNNNFVTNNNASFKRYIISYYHNGMDNN